jgi:hypothetical protein
MAAAGAGATEGAGHAESGGETAGPGGAGGGGFGEEPGASPNDHLEQKRKTFENIRRNLDEPTLQDAAENLKGNYKYWPDGKRINHLRDVQSNQRGLRNLIRQVNGALSRQDLSPDDQQAWQQLLQEATELLQHTTEYVP